MEEQCQQLMSEVQALKAQLQAGFQHQNAGLEHITSVLQQLNKNSSASFLKLESLRVEETAALNIRLQEAVDVADMLKRLDEATKEVKFLKRACQNYEAEAMANADAVMELKQLKGELERMRAQELRERNRLKDLLHQSQEQLQCTQAELIEVEKKAKQLEVGLAQAQQVAGGSSFLNTLSGGLVELVPSTSRAAGSCPDCNDLKLRVEELSQQLAEKTSELNRVKKYAQRFAKALKEQRVLRKEGWEGGHGPGQTPTRQGEDHEGVHEHLEHEDIHTGEGTPWKAAGEAAGALVSTPDGKPAAATELRFVEPSEPAAEVEQHSAQLQASAVDVAAAAAVREELMAQLQELVVVKQSNVEEVEDTVAKIEAVRQTLLGILTSVPLSPTGSAVGNNAGGDTSATVAVGTATVDRGAETVDMVVQTDAVELHVEAAVQSDVSSLVQSADGSPTSQQQQQHLVVNGHLLSGSDDGVEELPPAVVQLIHTAKSEVALKTAQCEAMSRELAQARQQLAELTGLIEQAANSGAQEAAAAGSVKEYRELLELQGLAQAVKPSERREERLNAIKSHKWELSSMLEASLSMVKDMKQDILMDSLSEPSTPTISEFSPQPPATADSSSNVIATAGEPGLWENVSTGQSSSLDASGDGWALSASNGSGAVAPSNPATTSRSLDGGMGAPMAELANGGTAVGAEDLAGLGVGDGLAAPGSQGQVLVPELPPGMPAFEELPLEMQQLFYDNPDAFFGLIAECQAQFGAVQ